MWANLKIEFWKKRNVYLDNRTNRYTTIHNKHEITKNENFSDVYR